MNLNSLAASVLLPADAYDPLGDLPLPDYIPPFWIGPHCGLRLVEAFRTLSRLPMPGLSQKMTLWPSYAHEWADLIAQEQQDIDDKATSAREANRVRLRPSANDISRMETAIIWPARYLQEKSNIGRCVMQVAWLRGTRDMDLERIGRKLRLDPEIVRKRNRHGLDDIAAGLCRDRVQVF